MNRYGANVHHTSGTLANRLDREKLGTQNRIYSIIGGGVAFGPAMATSKDYCYLNSAKELRSPSDTVQSLKNKMQ